MTSVIAALSWRCHGVIMCARVLMRLACPGSILLTILLSQHHFFHLLNRYCTFDIDPLSLDYVFLLQFQHEIDATNIPISDEAEASRLTSSFIL